MKKLITLITASASLLLFSGLCFADSIVTNVPAFKGGLTSAAYYQNGAQAISYCQSQQGSIQPCLVNYAKQHGASEQAIEFMNLTSGYISKINNYGNISVVLANVFAADHSQDIYLINKQGDFIDPNNPAYQTIDKLLAQNPEFKALSQNGSNPLHLLDIDVAPQANTDAAGNQSIIFEYRLTTRVACANVGVAHIAFNFDSKGTFTNISVKDVTPATTTAPK